MTEGRSYQIDMGSIAFDSYLRLEGPDGVQVAQDDDSGGGRDARISYRCTRSGTYRVVATSFQPLATGGFSVSVRQLNQ